jgi:hypothetical protein
MPMPLMTLDSRPTPAYPCSHSNSTGNLTDRYATNELQPKNFAHLAHDRSLCWHPVSPLETAKGARPESASRGHLPSRAISSRNGGRHHLGTVGGIISEWVGGIIPESWAACSGIRNYSPQPCRSTTGLPRAKAFAPSVAMPGHPAGRRFSAGSRATRNFADEYTLACEFRV